MKWLIALLLTCSSVLGQGFGSFSYDQPFLSANRSSFPPWIAAGGLVAYWRLDELTGGGTNAVFHDSTSNDYLNKLTQGVIGTPVSQAGIVTNSLLFDGSLTSFARCNDNSLLSWVSNLTYTAWVYQTNAGPNAFIIAKINTGVNFEYSLQTSGSSAVTSVKPNGGSQIFVTATAPTMPLNGWLFVVGQINAGANTARIRTATTASMGAWFSSGYTGTPSDNNGAFSVGSDGTVPSFRGRIDEVTIWTNILSDTDITNLWNRTTPFN